jgi:hypothetical protein
LRMLFGTTTPMFFLIKGDLPLIFESVVRGVSNGSLEDISDCFWL